MTQCVPVVCEGCRAERHPAEKRWYVDPEGVELCSGCADDLFATWKTEGFFTKPLSTSRATDTSD